MTGEPGDGRSIRRHGRRARAAWVALGLALGLAGCDGAGLGGALGRAGGASGGDADGPAEASRSTQLVETDVEAPEVFQVTDQGLWDGRPSLGGVWVAHPDVGDPERVVIRNQETGQFVIGALFRRERESPGPPLQVSSDAAEALAMLAGAPATLNVTALRREEAAAPAPTDATAPAGIATDAALPAPGAEDVVEGEVVAPTAPEAVTTASLDAVPLDAAPQVAVPDPDSAVARATAAILGGASASAAPAPAPAPAPASGSGLERPFIQLGIFSVEANAQALAEQMSAQGLPARVEGSTSQGADFFRVLVGPAATEAERDALLARVVAQGFDDAYAVRN